MAIVALIFFFPLGIPAVINAARVKPRLLMGDLAAARRASSNVKIFFWIFVALLGIAIFASAFQSPSSTGTTGLARTILP